MNIVHLYYKLILFYTAEKFMSQDNLCKNCDKADTCRQVYENIGKSKGPSIALKVIIAFLLPIIVFITVLAIFEKLLQNLIPVNQLRTVLSLLAAVAVTFTVIAIIKFINRQLSKNR